MPHRLDSVSTREFSCTCLEHNLPSIAIARREAHEAVGQVVRVDESAESAAKVWRIAHGTIPVPNNGLGDQRSKVVVRLPTHTLDSKDRKSTRLNSSH